MLERFQHLVHQYLPLMISVTDSRVGPRIGCEPPEGVTPRYADRNTKYFATLPLADSGRLEVSLFHSLDPDVNSPRSGLRAWRVVHPPGSDLVEAVVHEPRPRAAPSAAGLASDWSSHSLLIGEPTNEPEDALDAFSGHDGDKMGGIPRYDQVKDPIFSDARRLIDKGYVHFVQFNSVGPRGCPLRAASSWPFGNHIFHAWCRYSADAEFLFRFGWA